MKTNTALFCALAAASLILTPSFSLAAEEVPSGITIPGVGEIPKIQPLSDWKSALARVVNWALVLAGLLAFIFFLYAGFQYLTAGGGDGAETAKKTMVNAIIGLVIIFISMAVVRFVIENLNSSSGNSAATSESGSKSGAKKAEQQPGRFKLNDLDKPGN